MAHSSGNSGKSQEADSIFFRAESLRQKACYHQAISLFKKALHGYRKTFDQAGIYHCMLALGDVYRMTGGFDLAAKFYTESIDLARNKKSGLSAADAKTGLGLSLRAQGEWKEALRLIRASRNMYIRNLDREGLAFTLWAEAGTLRIKGAIPEAIGTYRQSYKIFRALEDDYGIGFCLCGLGGATRIAGKFQESLRYYVAANRMFSRLRDTFGRAYSHCGIGNAYRMLGDYRTSFAHFKKATTLYKTMGDKVSYAYTLWGIGTAYKMIGRYKEAIDSFAKAQQLFKKTKDPRGTIYCRLGFGEIALLKGKKVIAGRYFSEAWKSAEKFSFAIEKCHAIALMSHLDQEGISRGTDNSCYNRLGVNLRFHCLPLNIP